MNRSTLAFLLVTALAAPTVRAQEPGFEAESYVLDNGMRVTLVPDRSLPKVVINTWFGVGSKDEAPGRTGFAHLFEHLMFMGTGRVPGSQFDVIMESGGGFNNATTSNDRTNYFSQGPSSLLPTLLWLDADRFDALADHMTQEKLDTQRGVVRNERRQTGENVPYGRARLMLPELLYPDGHPYRHSVIGSHADLEAATLEDVIEFFRTWYVPANASLVVAGDFDVEATKDVIERTMGVLEPEPVPKHTSAAPVTLVREVRGVTWDDVELPKLILAWHSPAYMTDGDGAMDVVAAILAGGPATRLEKRLVVETGLAQEVVAYQASAALGSTFQIHVTGTADADLDRIETEVLDVLDALVHDDADTTRDAELARVQAQLERGFLQGNEDLLARADAVNRYLYYWNVVDGFERDLRRWTGLRPDDVRDWAGRVFGAGHVDLRVLPTEDPTMLGELERRDAEGERDLAHSLDDRPADFEPARFTPPLPTVTELSNGVRVVLHPRPGTRLFTGTLLVPGGEARVPAERAGLASLTARLLTQGAGGLDAAEWAQAVESLGASIDAGATREHLRVEVSGLTSRIEETLDRFAEAVLAPNLDAEDFQREQGLHLGEIRRRGDNPRAVASLAARSLLFGHASHRGRPIDGWAHTVEPLTLGDVTGAWSALVGAEGASLVFVGDFEPDALVEGLEQRFGELDARVAQHVADRAPRRLAATASAPALDVAPEGRTVLVDRPGAPQTVVYLLRPLAPATDRVRALRTALNTALGGSFTSRLNMNLRERNRYSYGAGSRVSQEGDQVLLLASSSVQTDVTGKALAEFKKELDALAAGDVTEEELSKALESARTDLMGDFGTTRAIAATFGGLVADGRPLDAKRTELAELARVDLAAVNELASSGLYDWSKYLVVLVGDAEAVVPQLEEAGFSAPLRADETGRILD